MLKQKKKMLLLFAAAAHFQCSVRTCEPDVLVTDAMLAAYRNDEDTPLSAFTFEQWSVEHVTDFSRLFEGSQLNPAVDNWDVSGGRDFTNMFAGAVNFNRPLTNWNLRSAKTFEGMLSGAASFNQTIDISAPNAKNFKRMLSGATAMEMEVAVAGSMHFTMECDSMLEGANRFNNRLTLFPLHHMHSVKNILKDATLFNQQLLWETLHADCAVDNALVGTNMQYATDCWPAAYTSCAALGTPNICGPCNVGIPPEVAHGGAVALIVTTVIIATAGTLNVLSTVVFGAEKTA